MDIVRTYRDGVWQKKDAGFLGEYYKQIDDPDANEKVSIFDDSNSEYYGVQEYFKLNLEIPRIDATNWSAWVDLAFDYADQGNEVSSQIWIDGDNGEYLFISQRQGVSGASVDHEIIKVGQNPVITPSLYNSTKSIINESYALGVNIVTGEEVRLPLEGNYIFFGDVHSHNTMNFPDFSKTDDEAHLGNPGWHLLVSCLDLVKRTYRITCSVVWDKHRYLFPDHEKFIDTVNNGVKYHPKVKEYVKRQTYTPPLGQNKTYINTTGKKGWNWGWGDTYGDDTTITKTKKSLSNYSELEWILWEAACSGLTEKELLDIYRSITQ
jgi:hypothetical protein